MRPATAFAILFFLAASLFAAEPTSSLSASLSQFCSGLTSLLPVAAMLMVLVGAVTYAVGQLMGAETRARANVWATASLTGAIMGLLITAVAPPVLQTVYGSSISCSGAPPQPTCRGDGESCGPSIGSCCPGLTCALGHGGKCEPV